PGGLDDDVVERDLTPVAELLVQGLARLGRPLHVHFAGEKEVGNGTERRHAPLGDGLTDLGQGNVFERNSADRGMRDAGRRGMRDAGCGMRVRDGGDRCRSALSRALEVPFHDPAAGSGARDQLQVDARLARHALAPPGPSPPCRSRSRPGCHPPSPCRPPAYATWPRALPPWWESALPYRRWWPRGSQSR